MATIRKRGDGWQAQVRKAGAAPQSATWPTRAAAERWARRVEHEIDEGRSRGGRPATGTLGELIHRYRSEVGGVGGFGRGKELALRILARDLGTVRLRDLDADRLIRHGRERFKAGAGAATVAGDLSALGTLLRHSRALWRLSLDDRPVNEARQALALSYMVGRSRQRERRPTQAELDALFRYFREQPRAQLPMADIVGFAIGSAMRLGEITQVRRDDLDPVARTILIRSRKDPRRPRDQIIPLLDVTGFDPVAIALRQPVVLARSARAHYGQPFVLAKGPHADLYFPYKPPTVTRAWQRACAALGIVDLRFHDMRHEAVSRLFEAGLSIEQVAMVSGHRSWANLKRYTQLAPSHVTSAFPPSRSPRAT